MASVAGAERCGTVRLSRLGGRLYATPQDLSKPPMLDAEYIYANLDAAPDLNRLAEVAPTESLTDICLPLK